MGSDNKVVTMAYELDAMSDHLGAFGKLLGDLRDIKTRMHYQLHGEDSTEPQEGQGLPKKLSLTGANAVLRDHVGTLQDLVNELHGDVGSFDKQAEPVGSTSGGPSDG